MPIKTALESKLAKRISFGVQLLLGLFFVGLGISMIFRDNFWWSIVYAAILVGLIGIVIVFLYRALTSRNRANFLISGGSLIFAIVIVANPNFYKEFFALSFGIWALFNAAVRALEFYVAYIEKQRGKIIIAIEFVIEFGMAILLITSGINNYFLINLQVGIYIILQGIMQIMTLIRVELRSGYMLRMPSPVILTAFLPSFLFKKIQKEVVNNPEIVKDVVEPTHGDFVSIYIYAKNHGYNRMGHIDIGYNGAIYSYGCHDPFARVKTQAYGDGVLIIGSETEYVQYCVDDDTTVFRFLCKLTPVQKEHIEKRIDQLMENAYYFDYPMSHPEAKDYFLGFLKRDGVTVDYYKFTSGPFKTYNVFTTNCVLVADYIVQSTGMQLFHLDGIITPGTYYQYLHQNLNRPGSIVVSEDIYKNLNVKPDSD